ncbi:translocation protein SEC63 homolog isoform X3 [Saccostrea echinata]|uniref:translocation protein SEC63 homolog isoform X3 n=1 Tax=Saccostrea echinata TaxID=191078 RepID=UPI002A82F4C3|nr:translocation protein SEC63 homolog isoform X3 [Saccostrea echinata]
MPGMQFEYDEEGGTFFYFLFSLWGLVLIPATYYFWPRKSVDDDKDKKKRECNCDPCVIKRHQLKSSTKWNRMKEKVLKVVFIIAWIIFALLAYKVSQIHIEYQEYDPYAELGLDVGATKEEIKKAYKKLSLKYHPDKPTGDHKKFMKIAKAYTALTDEETRKIWEESGDPDGPGVTRFGIALPKWIVEKQNSMWVLLVYGLLFMVLLPVVVGVWWYRSIKFSKDQVLLDTTRLYYYFFQKNPNMILKRVIMVLAGSFEFDKFHNAEIVERPSDNEEVPMLIKRLPNLDEKNKEKPLCYPYSVKARALLHAHFQRLDLPPDTLAIDQAYVVKKCPYLINEMINVIAQLVAGAHRNAVQYMPRLETVENCMKLSQMLIQAVDVRTSPLLQLPHLTQDMLKHFTTKKRHIQRIRDLIGMKEEDRRSLLRHMTSDEYRDIINVCATLPHVKMEVHSTVLDDEDTSITAGSIVTVNVSLTREMMEVLFDKEDLSHVDEERDNLAIANEETESNKDQENETEDNVEAKEKAPIWHKQKKQPKKKGGNQKNKKVKQAYNWKAAAATNATANDKKEGKGESEKQGNEVAVKDDEEDREENDNDSERAETDEETNASDGEDRSVDKSESSRGHEEDEEQWRKYQEEAKKEQQLDTKVKESHPVHCPYYGEEKQEGWWLYVCDKKSHMLITAPVQILTLKDTEEMTLKFSAPHKPGLYTYTVVLRSDCYVDFDQSKNIRLDVKEAKVIDDHPQWDFVDDEEDKDKDDETDSDYSTDFDESDDD